MMVFFPLIWILFGVASVIVASQKGRSGCAWFALGFLLGPFGLLFVLLVNPLKANPDTSQPPVPLSKPPLNLADVISLEQETKKCPHCAETIKLEANKCRYCLEPFNPETVALEIAARRAELEEDYRKLSEGKYRCPKCASWDVLPCAVLPDGGHGPWCPHCQIPVPK